jgi:hypothetical protein
MKKEPTGKSFIRYALAGFSILGLVFGTALLFPVGKNVIIGFAERFVFHEQLKPQYIDEAKRILAVFAKGFICLIVFIDFWVFTGPGKKLLDKIGFVDVKQSDVIFELKSLVKRVQEKRFELFALLTGSFVLILAFCRAVNTGVTYDEAATYINYVRMGFIDSLFRRQFLNNHILNSLLIRFVCFISQAQYNEFFIRLPSLLFYGVYILFAFRIAKLSNQRYFIFILCIANYYLNEFFSLARGYGMAGACLLGAFYYFDILRNDINNKKILHKFFAWSSLAAIANGIALYTIFCVLVILVFKYRKNIIKLSNCPYFLVFLAVALHVVLMSRPGRPVASTNSFYDSIITSVFGTFSFHNPTLSFGIYAFFLAILIFGMVATKFRNDYGLMYIVFLGIALISNTVFHRGYPIAREMIPFYPVVIFVILETLRYTKKNIAVKLGVLIFGVLLCFQFIMQVDLQAAEEGKGDYQIRREVFEYFVKKDDITEYKKIIDDYGNPVADFYDQKYNLLLREQ